MARPLALATSLQYQSQCSQRWSPGRRVPDGTEPALQGACLPLCSGEAEGRCALVHSFEAELVFSAEVHRVTHAVWHTACV